MKITPMRTDIVSRKRFPKEELLRLVRVDGCYVYDPSGVAAGRGIYLAKNKANLEILVKKNCVQRVGKAPLKEGELEKLEAAM